VIAAGSRIQGLKARSGLSWKAIETVDTEVTNNREIVQLKFLSKSNKRPNEQVIYDLLQLKPLVIH